MFLEIIYLITSLYQDLYQNLMKCFSDYIPRSIIPNILKEENLDPIIDGRVNATEFRKSEREKETYKSIEDLKYQQEHVAVAADWLIFEMTLTKSKQMVREFKIFKRSRHNKISLITISQNYNELPSRTLRDDGIIYQIFTP